MTLDKSPTDITDEETYWLRSQAVSDSPNVAGDGYFERHDVPFPEETTAENLPPAEDVAVGSDEAVRELDREALDEAKFIGKWQLTGSAERIEELWPELVADAADEVLWAAKAMTGFGYENLPMYDEYMITVYTPNYFAKRDVDRVRDHLREEYGVTKELLYKPDLYTAKGIVPDNVEEFGLSMAARYCE
ncbi:DUF1917 domain-containing protein [Halorussus gelatinilyticus]|uniref:DUF1917 domain-containing protein n=1 Tax=Halorussus gelatinilyticus TaxID=2937524 RepID=A0A8U0IDI6_9EURY|nr:putative phosphothreonine lyase domain-containg protein [Halorussus gelatinilyticus]UPV99116.1 DUF1917 domain-containing protein [Halorussus gelatinilyticus]